LTRSPSFWHVTLNEAEISKRGGLCPGLSIGPADATLFVAHFVALSRLRTAGGVAGVLRLASRANMAVNQNCCVNTWVGPPVLWQPQVRPAPARHTTRLWGEVLGRSVGERLQAKRAVSPRGICMSRYVFCSEQHHAPQGWWAGCPFVGPIRGCCRVGGPATVLTQQPWQA